MFPISERSSSRLKDGENSVRWLEKRRARSVAVPVKGLRRKVRASKSFQCWHFPCGELCWMFPVSEWSCTRLIQSEHSIRWLEKRRAPVLLGL